jgi:hypothetical protein
LEESDETTTETNPKKEKEEAEKDGRSIRACRVYGPGKLPETETRARTRTRV